MIVGLTFYACNTIARDGYMFYRTASLYISELLLYESYALFSLWGKWTSYSLLFLFKWIMDPELDEIETEWIEIEKTKDRFN